MTRMFAATLPNGETFSKEIKVKNTTSCAYEFAVFARPAGAEAFHLDSMTRYEKEAVTRLGDLRRFGHTGLAIVAVRLESVLIP